MNIESTLFLYPAIANATGTRKKAAAMKKAAIQYLAFDVHQATTVACLRNETGRVIKEATVPTEATALVRLVTSADDIGGDEGEGTDSPLCGSIQTSIQRCHPFRFDHANGFANFCRHCDILRIEWGASNVA